MRSTYYYAYKVTQYHENPYHTQNLTRQAKIEGTRKSVHPAFHAQTPFSLHEAERHWTADRRIR